MISRNKQPTKQQKHLIEKKKHTQKFQKIVKSPVIKVLQQKYPTQFFISKNKRSMPKTSLKEYFGLSINVLV